MIWRIKRLLRPSLIKRRFRFFLQRRIRGWDDSDTWTLDTTMCKILVPRLKRFKELNNGYPTDSEEIWDRYLDRMIAAAELYSKGGDWTPYTLKEKAILRRGKKLFFKYFESLWW